MACGSGAVFLPLRHRPIVPCFRQPPHIRKTHGNVTQGVDRIVSGDEEPEAGLREVRRSRATPRNCLPNGHRLREVTNLLHAGLDLAGASSARPRATMPTTWAALNPRRNARRTAALTIPSPALHPFSCSRYRDYLAPQLVDSVWTPDEHSRLFELHAELGNRCACAQTLQPWRLCLRRSRSRPRPSVSSQSIQSAACRRHLALLLLAPLTTGGQRLRSACLVCCFHSNHVTLSSVLANSATESYVIRGASTVIRGASTAIFPSASLG